MIQLLKITLFILLFLIFILVGFYFWGSSSKFKKENKAKIKIFNHPLMVKNDSVLSIITYNIGYLSGMTNNLPIKNSSSLFESNLKSVKQQFRDLNADILVFQEIDYKSNRSYFINQQDEIASLGYKFAAEAINWDKRYVPFPWFPIASQFGEVLSGQSVLSKFKITEQKRIELIRNPTNPFYYDAFYIDRLAQVVKIKIENEILVLINVHIEAYHKETRVNQTKKAIELYQKYSKNFPTILIGDFNSDIHFENPSIKLILNLPNTGNAVYKKAFPKTYNSINPTERLDYIFYNKNHIEFIDGKVLSEFGDASDHLPLLMNFKIKTNGNNSY